MYLRPLQSGLPLRLRLDVVNPCVEHLFVALYSAFPRELLEYLAATDLRVREVLLPLFAHVRLHPQLVGLSRNVARVFELLLYVRTLTPLNMGVNGFMSLFVMLTRIQVYQSPL